LSQKTNKEEDEMIGIIGGTSLKKFKKKGITFINRHGEEHLPPHKIDYKKNIRELYIIGVDKIIGVFSVGGLKESLRIGDFIIPDDFIDLTKNRETTIIESIHHESMNEPFDQESIKKITHKNVIKGGTYICIEGSRFSTKAENKMFKMIGGTIVGMTMIPECVYAKELGIKYVPFCMVTDKDSDSQVTYDDMKKQINKSQELLEKVLKEIIEMIE
jgi:5'-methylthioadenosine phosphorylase